VEQARKWAEEDGGVDNIRQISPSQYKMIFGDFKPVNKFIKRYYDAPLDFWRTLTLTYRPAWMVNNIVGQTLLYAMNNPTWGGAKSYARAVSEAAHRDLLIPEDLRYQSLMHVETPKIKASMNRFVRAEERVRDRIQRANALLSDDIPRAAAYRAMLDKIAKTDETARELRDILVQSKGSTKELAGKTKALHDEIVQNVLDMLIDFRNLSNAERAVLRRVFPFYSWMKGITKATALLWLHHPARVWVMFQLSKMGEEETDRRFGEGVSGILPGFVPFGSPEGGIQRGFTTTGINPYSTPGGIAGQLGKAIGLPSSPIDNPIFSTSPIIQAAVTAAAQSDLFSGRKKEEGFLATFVKEMMKSPPQVDLAFVMIHPNRDPKKLSPQDRWDSVARYFGLPLTRKRISVAQSLAGKEARR
jgi:hypothetical protein